MRLIGTGVAAGVGAGAAVLAYGVGIERNAWRLRRATAPVLSPGSAALRILHLSDLHMLPRQRAKQRWLRDLGRLVPDLVVLTGDVLSSGDAGPAVLDALEPLLDRPGMFVPGNNDYFEPTLKNPLRYLTGREASPTGRPLDWPGFARDLAGAGWHDLTQRRLRLDVDGRSLDVRGVDDPHLERDRIEEVAGPADADAALRLGLAHTPEPRVLDAFTADGVDLLLAGHTHGGQVRLPGVGAIVTNCGIDRARAMGLHRYGARGNQSWLHVSGGIGTGPYSPLRLGCRPEATLLTVTARDDGPARPLD
jgi:predicted MPP superfamily phosphohydrolase